MSKPLGQVLREMGRIEEQQLEDVLDRQSKAEPRQPIGAMLVNLHVIDEGQLAEALASQMGVEVWDVDSAAPDPKIKELIPPALAQCFRVVPQARENGYLRCLTSGPISPGNLAKLRFMANRPVRLVITTESSIAKLIQELYGISVESMIADLSVDGDEDKASQEVFIHDLREMAQEPTLINLVNMIISNAIGERASDIHVEPFEAQLIVKYRVDGILREAPPPPKQFQSAIVSRIKIMAGMDIAERYIPQDGHIRVNLPAGKVDIRVSTVPTVYGESVVLRLLNKDKGLLELTELGMQAGTHAKLTNQLGCPYGILLVTGPTGSGKTTTLYSALQQIYTPEKKMITIEDPVEYQIQGINQIPVRPKRGLTFASGLRSILRQDPDIIMVGEVRDRETADIAIQAALTGHLVFSTLHTNDAPGAITRLMDMGVEPFLIASAIEGVLGQRLVRQLCMSCRVPIAPAPSLRQEFDVPSLPGVIHEPSGCKECGNRGYFGRIGLFELLTINEPMHDLILSEASSSDIRNVARGTMQTMRQDGWEKIRRGMTSVSEVIQATRFDHIEEI